MNALYRAVLVATLISALIFHPGDDGLRLRPETSRSAISTARRWSGSRSPRSSSESTEFYTGTRWNPVKAIARASQTGHATNIIEASPSACRRTALPVVVIAIGILLCEPLAGLFGIGVAVMAQLSMTGLIVALDAYGRSPTTQAGSPRWRSPPEVACITDPLDAVGNTTKGRDEGLCDRSAALAALVLFGSYSDGLAQQGLPTLFQLKRRLGHRGLLIGGLMPFLFASLAMQAVGASAARSWKEVRASPRASRDHGDRASHTAGDHIVTGSAIASMILPAMADLFPIIAGDQREMLGDC